MYKVIRELGSIEKYQVARLCGSSTTNLIIESKIKINDSLNSSSVNTKDYIESRLYPALNHLCQRVAQLSLSVTDIYTDSPKFIQINTLNLKDIVTFQKIDNNISIDINNISNNNNKIEHQTIYKRNYIEEEINQRFDIKDNSKPLWRIRVVYNSDTIQSSSFSLVLVATVLIVDSISLVNIMKQLVQFINTDNSNNNNVTEQSIVNLKDFQDNLTIRPYIENLLSIAGSLTNPINTATTATSTTNTNQDSFFSKIGSKLYDLIQPPTISARSQQIINRLRQTWSGTGKPKTGPVNTKLIQMSFDEYPQLNKRCIENQTCVDSAIHTATVLALLTLFGSTTGSDNRKQLILSSRRSFDVRTDCYPNVPADEIGNYQSFCDHDTIYYYDQLNSDSNFWSECKHIDNEKQVKRTKYNEEYFHIITKTGFPESWMKSNQIWSSLGIRASSFITNHIKDSDCIASNNCGDTDSNDQSEWNIIDHSLYNCTDSCGAVFKIASILTTKNNYLNLSLSWSEDSITEDQANRILKLVSRILHNTINKKE